jgi:AraC-like DNA-binding protein
MEYVELHLTDPDLLPEVIARAHRISVRCLHKLFKEESTTVGRWILRRRLEECRRDLMRNGRGSRTIAAVAGRWGFLSAAHFSRVFRSAYGMSPREWRDMAGRGGRRGVTRGPGIAGLGTGTFPCTVGTGVVHRWAIAGRRPHLA